MGTGYFLVKYLHILSSTMLLGLGLGSAFFLFTAYRRGHNALRGTANHVVIADWIVLVPAIIVQLVTGLWLTLELNIPFTSAWFVSVLGLFFITGLCWLPMAWIQFELSHTPEAAPQQGLYPRDRRLMRIWSVFCVLGFVLLLILAWLMVAKPGIAMRWF